MNKKAYQYIRISQEDQSNFSITGQKRFNDSFAARIDCDIIKTFIDDGRSAKDFNRPQWRLLEKEIYQNRHRIDYLIIAKYDRLIRNVREGLVFLEKIENKWGIRVISAMEDYYSHPDDPMFVRDRTQRLLDAEVERLRTSDRVKFGNWQASSEGRYVHPAPYGYTNERDEGNRPILVLDPNKASVVQFIFESFIAGIPLATIKKQATQKGLTLQGRSAIPRVLSNPIYAGMVTVKAYRNEKERKIKGIHEGIIDEKTFYIAQSMLRLNEQGSKIVISDEMPLRGLIACMDCSSIYTGGRSKGRNKYYHYYRCPECAKANVSAPKVHKLIDNILAGMTIPEKYLSYIRLQSKARIEKIEKEQKSSINVTKSKISAIDRKIESLTEKFISDQVNQKTYDQFRSKYESEKSVLESSLSESSLSKSEIVDIIDEMIPVISNLSAFFNGLTSSGKQVFFSGLFGVGSKASQHLFEPHFTHPIFNLIDLNINGLQLPQKPDIGHYLDDNYISARSGTSFEPIFDLMEVVRKSRSA